jgi:hypothetical protein
MYAIANPRTEGRACAAEPGADGGTGKDGRMETGNPEPAIRPVPSFSRRAALALPLALGLAFATVSAHAQMQAAPAAGSASRPLQLPLSGRQTPGPAVIEQSAAPAPGASVNTINTQIQVPGPLAGGVPDGHVPAGTLVLTLTDAVRRGLAANLGVIGADAASRQAAAQHAALRSVLLPNVSASLAEDAAKISLQSEGLSQSAFGTGFPFRFPTTVGPFHYYDLHGSLEQKLLDFPAIYNL